MLVVVVKEMILLAIPNCVWRSEPVKLSAYIIGNTGLQKRGIVVWIVAP